MQVQRRLFCALLFTLCAACSHGNAPVQTGKPVVVTTMSTLRSLIQMVTGDRLDVVNLVPVGSSPEDYQPTPQDVARLRSAGLLIQNGAGLETWVTHLVDGAKNPKLQVLTCTDGLPVRNGNPHLWMDPILARSYVQKIEAAVERFDPSGRALYRRNLRRAKAQLAALDRHVRAQIRTIPPANRTMIVFHNAWQYYNDRYGIRTVGAIELSPGQEPSPRYIAQLIALAKRYRVRAIFAEPEYSPKLARMLAENSGIQTVTDLYDDSLGSDSRVGDYISLISYDTGVIVRALK
ncbi:MAG: zinc ABC transporter substrate-binding protein [Candidatus Eremiobacteraeota bacterium]|nr:zinc ABC transporter substrate-binding protein [Candidatus Eremiobacteraeota bacterium]